MMRRLFIGLADRVRAARIAADELGQTTAEYALVILGAAAIGTLILTWATRSHAIQTLFERVIGKILPG